LIGAVSEGGVMMDSPYVLDLGAVLDALESDKVRLSLPFKEINSNPGGALHGGVAASMINLAGLTLGRHVLGDEASPIHTAQINIQYLAAAINEAIVAEATLLRRGKELVFVEVAVSTQAGKQIAAGSCVVRGRFNQECVNAPKAEGDSGGGAPGPMGDHLPKRVPFIGRRGLKVENMTEGRSRIVMPCIEVNGDVNGGAHEGAILALMDTTGAMAAWAETGPGAYKASTVQLAAQLMAPARREELIGYGRMVARDRELFWCEIEVASRADGRLIARGTELYRIVTS
jgi:uncharacterized protein (TIGR00369 family)